MMSQQPNDPHGGPTDPQDPLARFFAELGIPMPPGMGGMDMNSLMTQLGAMMQQFQQAGRAGGSGVNWDQTLAAARQVTASMGPDPIASDSDRRRLADADRLAQSWLDPVTSFTADGHAPRILSRAEWVDQSMPAWRTLVDPIVSNIARATGTMMGRVIDEDIEETNQTTSGLPDLTNLMAPMLRQAIAVMYSMQFAQAIGKLATHVLVASEFGVPLLDGRSALVISNVNFFAEGLSQPHDDVLLYLALREAAGQRLFSSVGWLGPQLVALVEHYSREIQIDADAITASLDIGDMASLTPERMQELSDQLTGKMFSPERTPAQRDILDRLETLLALVEGWIDEVTSNAAEAWLPNADALAEAWRRRRASGGPSEAVFKSLVGLEMRPRRVRDAANLWALLASRQGIDGRDLYWSHPDLMPTAAHLDDPLSLLADDHAQPETTDWDADLQRLLGHDDSEDPDKKESKSQDEG